MNMWILRHLLVVLMHLVLGSFAQRYSNGYYYQDIVNGNGNGNGESKLIYLRVALDIFTCFMCLVSVLHHKSTKAISLLHR